MFGTPRGARANKKVDITRRICYIFDLMKTFSANRTNTDPAKKEWFLVDAKGKVTQVTTGY